MIEQLEDKLKTHWNGISKESCPDTIDFLYKSGFRKDILIAFSGNNPQPIAIGYMSNEEKIIERLKNQYTALNRIHSLDNHSLKQSVPKSYIWDTIRRYQILFLSCIDGNPLIITLKKRPPSKNELMNFLVLGERWLAELHNASANATIPIEELLNDRGLDNSLFELTNLLIPTVLKHGDFQPTNLLLTSDQKINVIDWEYADNSGLPLYDLFYYISYLIKQSKHNSSEIASLSKAINPQSNNLNIPDEKDFEDIYFSGSQNSRLALATIESFCAKTNMDIKLVKVLFYLFLYDFMGEEYMSNFLSLKDQFII